MTVGIERRWDQQSTFENDRRYVPTPQLERNFTRSRSFMSRHYAMTHHRLGQVYFQPIVRK